MTPFEVYDRLSNIDKIFTADEADLYFDEIGDLPIVKQRKGKTYYNAAASFDTETTSFETSDGERVGTMYVWILDVNGLVMYGRTWFELLNVYEKFVQHFRLGSGYIFPIYVHNLPFDFQFFRRWFRFSDIFALDRAEPIRATTREGVEFRCTYKLSGLSLAKVGENLLLYPVKKLVGDLDYTKIRHSGTPLTEQELGYCVNDVRVVVSYILEEIKSNGDVTKIPMTKTGYVRRYCREKCYGMDLKDKTERNKQYTKYRDLMASLTMTTDEYKQLRRAFAGGFTHAANWHVCRTMENVTSQDECSAYPAQMLARKFPMSRPEIIQHITREEFFKSLRLYCCLFDAHFVGLKQKRGHEHVLSLSKCIVPKTITGTEKMNHYFADNGKIVFADELFVTMTEVDYRILKQFYTWEKMEIKDFRRYVKGYLPTPFVKSILDLYVAKTELKGKEGKEAEYMLKKGMLNSAYGMAVTNIIRDIVSYDPVFEQWNESSKNDVDKVIDDYNRSTSRFLSYAWGVWVTAYAREAILLHGVKACGDDYVYTDTDSVKYLNADKHADQFASYNAYITGLLAKAMKHHGIDIALTHPKNKPIGVFEDEGTYRKFKTCGAKRYLVEHQDHEVVLTVSGLNKNNALRYMLEQTRTPYHVETRSGVDHLIADGDTTTLFDYFDTDLSIPAEHTGKNLHTYFDHEIEGELVDYLGNTGKYYELSGVNLSPVAYTANENTIWINYIMGKAGILYEK